jgi:hypothetical protein
MRAQSEVRDEVISRGGRYRVVHPKSEFSEDPSPLDVLRGRGFWGLVSGVDGDTS